MDVNELIELIIYMIVNKSVHEDYDRVCMLAEEYKILSTGDNAGKMLKQFVKRETKEEFALRCEITQTITPAVAASIKNPFYKVVRNERIKRGVALSTKAKEKQVQGMIDSFFGGGTRAIKKGLDEWLKTRKFALSFLDPNSWVIVEWKESDPSVQIKPYPYVVSAAEALNFEVVNDEVQWLFTGVPIMYRISVDPEAKQKKGMKYTMYENDFTIVVEEVDAKYLQDSGFIPAPYQEIRKVTKTGKTYLISKFTPNVGYPPAFRIGYKQDDVTDGRTFVNPWHDALCYFKKTLKAVSELDLTIAGHVFPQKFQFAPFCLGTDGKTCTKGRNKDGSVCDACNGSGYMLHQGANDALIFPMPDPGDTNILDLDKMMVYKSPPIDLVKLQIEYINQLEGKAHEAVFNTQMFIKKNGGGTGDSGLNTAFEIDMNMQSIYDTLIAFTEKDSSLYKEIVTVFCIKVGESIEKIKVTSSFPSDFKLKTQDMLFYDLEAAKKADAPSFVRDMISYDLANLTYRDDEMGLVKYRVKRQFFPFNGKTEEQIEFLMASTAVANREKVLYANFEAIFTEIEMEHPEFYEIPTFDAKYEIVEEKVLEWMAAIKAETPQITLPSLSLPGTTQTVEDPSAVDG